MKFSVISFCLLCCVNLSNAARILAVFTASGTSHHILGHQLMLGLAEAGHEVVYLTCFKEEIPSHLKYRPIVLDGIFEKQLGNNTNLFEILSSSLVLQTLFLHRWGTSFVPKIVEHPKFKELLASNETFDVVIVEQFFIEALKGLAWYYKAPLITFSTVGANSWFNALIGNPSPPSYIPEALSEFSSDMSFLERVQNSMSRVFVDFVLHFLHYPAQNKILHEYLPDAPHLNELLYNSSLVLVNSDISLHQPVPKVPNMIDIGGFHVKPSKSLPKDLQTFLDQAKEGVVYFSMGSNLKSAHLPNYTRKWLLQTFSKLKQKVLWKFEIDLPNKPANVKISEWLPQQDILGHPNVKLFITHGGLLSTTEAVYHGLPVLSIPVFGDQRLNAMHSAQKGIGLYIHYNNLTEAYFTECLDELLNNKRYAERAKQMSRIFHDRPMKPMDTANFWVEYVVRHHGAPHLRVAALKLNIFQYLLLDVIACIVAVFISLSVIIRYSFGKMCGQKKELKKTKTQ